MFLTSTDTPVGLKRRIAYAFILLISCMAIVSALAVKNAFEYAETTLTGEYLSDINDALIQVLNEGGAIRMPLTMKVYSDNPDAGMEPVPERYKSLPEGYSEVAEPPAVFAFRSQWQGHALVVVRDQESFEKTEQKMWLFSAITVIAVVFFATLLGTVLSRRIMRPVERLSEAVRDAAGGNHYKAIPREIMTNDEVGALAQLCDSSMRRLYDALKREKSFTGDVSHELRTPLTVIETSSELLEMTDLSPQQSRQVNRILRAVSQMRSLVTLFLQLARTERSIQGPSTDNVRELFTVVEEAWEPIAAKKHVKLSFVTAERCQGNFSPVLLATVMNNLVKNAVMYVSDGGRIEVIEKPDGFMVADNGPGIPPEDRKRIFAAFTRGTTARGSGEGLGLSIALRICERMGWQIRLLDQTDRNEKLAWATGAVFAVTLTGSAPVRKDMNAESG